MLFNVELNVDYVITEIQYMLQIQLKFWLTDINLIEIYV